MNVEKVTVAGKIFEMPLPFDEGHVLTSGEAGQLNQVYHENIRNNIAKSVKDATEKGTFTQEDFQARIDKICSEYEFGKRRASGPRTPADPVLKEALAMATTAATANLKAKGQKPSDFSNFKDIVARLVESNPVFKAKAAEIVAERQSLAAATLDDVMSGLTEAPPAEPQPEAAAAQG